MRLEREAGNHKAIEPCMHMQYTAARLAFKKQFRSQGQAFLDSRFSEHDTTGKGQAFLAAQAFKNKNNNKKTTIQNTHTKNV